MKSTALLVALIAGLALGLSACQQKSPPQVQPQAQPAPLGAYPAEPGPSLASLDTPANDDPYATDPIVNPEAHRARRSADAPPRNDNDAVEVSQPRPTKATSGRVHVVQQGETLYGLARQYYGSGKKWRVIFNANRNRLADVHDIKVGMKLIVP